MVKEKFARYEVDLTEKEGFLLSLSGEQTTEIHLTHQETAEVLTWLFAQRAELFQHITGHLPHEYPCLKCQNRTELGMTPLGTWEGHCWMCGARIHMSLAGQQIGKKMSDIIL